VLTAVFCEWEFDMSNEELITRLKASLEAGHDWPCRYTFKFIVPEKEHSKLRSKIPVGEITERQSSSGNYISVTIRSMMKTPDDVIGVYEGLSDIENLISL
jgi:putative lipoic acid-binding regulatory protein